MDLPLYPTRDGRLPLQLCAACGQHQGFLRDFCRNCLAPDPAQIFAGGAARLVVCTTIHRAPDPAWADRVPYHIVLVDLAEGPRVMALADAALPPGTRLQLRPGGLHELPCFTAAGATGPFAGD